MNMKFKPGDTVPARTLESVTGEPIKNSAADQSDKDASECHGG